MLSQKVHFVISSSPVCLQITQVGDPLAEWTSSSISGSLHKLTLAKLQPDSLYEVEMAAKNCAGLGQPAMMTFRTGKGTTLSEQTWSILNMLMPVLVMN